MLLNNTAKKLLLTGIVAILHICVHAQNAKENRFSVNQAVDYAMNNATQVRNALLDMKIQKEVNREITSNALPKISGSASFNYFPNIAVQVFPNFIAAATYGVLQFEGVKDGNGNPITAPGDFGLVQAQFGTNYNANAGFDLSQLLFDGQVFIGLRARDASLKFFQNQLDVTKEMIKVNVMKIYYQLVVGRQQLTSIDANVTRFEKLLADTKEINKNGFAENLDVDKINVQLNNLQTEKVKIENQLAAGNAALKFLMNMPQNEQLIMTDSITIDMIKDGVLDNSYNYADRKEFQLLETAKRLGEFNIKRHQLSNLPTIAAYGNFYKNTQRNQFNFLISEPWFKSSIIGARLSMPIFEGFAKTARTKKARLELEKTKTNIEQLKASIDNDVAQAKLKMTSSILTIDNQKKNMELAEKVYNTTKFKYEQGLGSNQEIYNSQTELKVAQNNYFSAMYDAIISKIDFLKATGKL